MQKIKAATSAKTSRSVLLELAQDPDVDVRISVASNSLTPISTLMNLTRDSQPRVRSAMARNTKTHPRVLTQLAQDSRAEVRGYVAGNPQTPISVLGNLSEDPVVAVRQNIACNTKTPLRLLRKLATDPSVKVRCTLVRHAKLPAVDLEQMAKDRNKAVRCEVARSTKSTAEVRNQLAQDSKIEVRIEVARNPKSSVDLLARLSQDPEPKVRLWVARSRKSPPSVLADLATDSDLYVRIAVAKHPNTPDDILSLWGVDLDVEIRQSVAGNSQTPPAVLARLAKDPDWSIRVCAVANPNTPPSVLNLRANLKDPWFQARLAWTDTAPESLLDRLVPDNSEEFLRASLETEVEMRVEQRELYGEQLAVEREVVMIKIASLKSKLGLEPYFLNGSELVRCFALYRSYELGIVGRDALQRKVDSPLGRFAASEWLLYRHHFGNLSARQEVELSIALEVNWSLMWHIRHDHLTQAELLGIVKSGRQTDVIFEIARQYLLTEEQRDPWLRAQYAFAGVLTPELRRPVHRKHELLTPELLVALSNAPVHVAPISESDWEDWDEWYEPGETFSEGVNGAFKTSNPQILVAVYEHTPAGILDILRKSKISHVRVAVASRGDTTEK